MGQTSTPAPAPTTTPSWSLVMTSGRLRCSATQRASRSLHQHFFPPPQARCLEYGGHSSHVTAVTFIHDDSRLISTGGRDTAVMQWTVTSTPTSSSSQH
ncbi:echinoderm microtubule-associated protein [Portunus trituberculatus]|uniref:Echinoderm microtubule-associated protein n=1 Tax=Portunus trituberculatus TaxID=210409 RepID=A0A5B7ILB6_PORTR|nr:echinoderm microtubule-associated protein [Portunus trituberculatus]